MGIMVGIFIFLFLITPITIGTKCFLHTTILLSIRYARVVYKNMILSSPTHIPSTSAVFCIRFNCTSNALVLIIKMLIVC